MTIDHNVKGSTLLLSTRLLGGKLSLPQNMNTAEVLMTTLGALLKKVNDLQVAKDKLKEASEDNIKPDTGLRRWCGTAGKRWY